MQFLLRILVASLLFVSCDAKLKGKKSEKKPKNIKQDEAISLASECTSDDDCPAGEQYCSGGLCQEFGFCRSLADCLNPSNEYNSILCLGYTDCVDNQCTTVCGSNVCPGGKPSVRCLASPCSVSTCISPTTCVDYYCGACNALFFDPKGDLACGSVDGDGSLEPEAPVDENTEVAPPGTCSSSDDCDGQFCAGGVCQDFGTCRDLNDCLNPSNEYNTILCVGYIDCVDNQCTRQCSESECPEDRPLAECQAPPCTFTMCPYPTTCVDYTCGGCNALCFSPSGDLPGVSIPIDELESKTTLCEWDSDCNSIDQYCGQGKCRNFGACSSDLDCFNPSNMYSTIFCVGPIQCQEGFCGRICDGECADNGRAPVPCGELKCDPKECGDEARCVLNECDECSSIFLDPAGHQVCDTNDDSTGVSPQGTCSSDDDCKDQFCAGGVCRDHGTCRDLNDCLNPSNAYGTVKCVGYIDCVDNQCIRECSNSDCPDGQPFTECQAPPCTFTTCMAPTTCVDYMCGGCNALCFSPDGNLPGFLDGDTPLEDTPEDNGISLAYECTSDDDCVAGSEYCSGGLCQEFGFCRDLADCLNPSNVYNSILCLGYVDCVDNQCGVQCSSDVCPGGEPSVRCFESPCSVSTCISPTTCVDYYCGGCNALFFDLKGDLACGSVGGSVEEAPQVDNKGTEVAPQGTCLSDDDCKDQFCAGGVCRNHGTCRDLNDCLNPSNAYGTVKCVGYIDCVDNQCIRECSNSDCPDGQPFTECQAPPCTFTTCMAPTTCVDYMCGGCNALCFSPDGNLPGVVDDKPDTTDPDCSKKRECPTTDNWFKRSTCSVKNAFKKARCAF